MPFNKQTRFLVILPIVLWVASCKTPHTISAPSTAALPSAFISKTAAEPDNMVSRSKIFVDPFLVQLIDVAVKQNPDVYIAMQRIETARSFFRIRKGAMLPSVEATANASTQKYGDYTMEGVGNFDTNLSGNVSEDQKVSLPMVPYYFLGLRSSWEIDLWGKLKNQKKAAYMRLLGTEQARNLVITTLIAEVSFRYFELLALDEEVAILKRNIALQDSVVNIAEVQKEAGRTTALAIQQFQAQLLRTKSLLAATEQSIKKTENELNYLLGRFPQAIPRNSNFLQQKLPEQIAVGLPQDVLNRRPDVLQAEAELKATKADVGAAKAALLPALTLSPFLGYSSFNSRLLLNPASIAYGIIGGATAPLINRSALKGGLNRAQAEQLEAHHNYNKVVLNAFQEIQTTLSNMDNLRNIYDLNQQEVQVLSDAISTSNDLFKVGYANYLEVITAQRNVLEAEINQVETKKKLFISLITVYRSTGGGW